MKIFGGFSRGRIAWLAIGVVLVIIGCVLPQVLLYLAGAVVVAFALAAFGPWWQRGAIGAGVIVAAVAVPLVLGSFVTNRDIAWRLDDVGDKAWTAGDHTYVQTGKGLEAVETTTGKQLWSSEENVRAVGHGGGVLTSDSLFDRDGKRLWKRDAVPELDKLGERVLARDKFVTVFAAGVDSIGAAADLTLVGVDDSGTIAWRRDIERASIPYVQNTVSIGDLLPRALAVRTVDDDRSVQIIDPATGRTETSLPAGAKDDSYALLAPVDDRVLAITNAQGPDCSITLLRSDQALWTTHPDVGCPRYIGNSSIRGIFDSRVYLDLHPLTAIDLDDGSMTPLTGVSDRAPLTEEAVISARPGRLAAIDPSTGEQLWERDADIRPRFDVLAGRSLVIKEPTHVPNPLLRPSFRFRESDAKFSDWSQRITVIDPHTGRDLASVIDPLGKAGDFDYYTAGDGVLILHRYYGDAFWIKKS